MQRRVRNFLLKLAEIRETHNELLESCWKHVGNNVIKYSDSGYVNSTYPLLTSFCKWQHYSMCTVQNHLSCTVLAIIVLHTCICYCTLEQKSILSRPDMSFVARVQLNIRAYRTGSSALTIAVFQSTWSVMDSITVETCPMNRTAVSTQ